MVVKQLIQIGKRRLLYLAFNSMPFVHTSQPPPDLYEQTGFDTRYAGCGLRLFLGFFTGVGLSLIYSAIAAIVALFGTGAAALEPSGPTPGRVIGLYLLAGALAGTVVGLLLPIARRRWGAALLGFLAAWAIYGTVFLHMDLEWPVNVLFAASIPGAVTGIPLGLHLWEPVQFKGTSA